MTFGAVSVLLVPGTSGRDVKTHFKWPDDNQTWSKASSSVADKSCKVRWDVF